MTVKEARLAMEGYLASKGLKPKKLMSRNEFLDLMGKGKNVNGR